MIPTQLKRVVTKTGNDSTIQEYQYNSSGKITALTAGGIQNGQPIYLDIKFFRDAAGIIQRQVLKNDALLIYGIDSIESDINYDAATSKYTYSKSVVDVFGFQITDSIRYEYDGSGRLTSEINYTDDGTGMGYVPFLKTEYTYTGNNLITEKFYQYDDVSSTFLLDGTSTYEYDAKTNPLQFSAEAPILGMSSFFPANNITKETYIATDPADNFTLMSTYTYNTVNRPVTAVLVNGATTSDVKFYYQ